MNSDQLKKIFNGYDASLNFDDGKSILIYYTKYEYVRIPIIYGTTEKDINNTIYQYKRAALDIISLIKWIKEDKMLGSMINDLMKKYFLFDIKFDIMHEGVIILKYYDKCEIFDPLNICENTKRNEIFNIILLASEFKKEKGMKYLEENLPRAILKSAGESFTNIYTRQLAGSDKWKRFAHKVQLSNACYNEFRTYMEQDGFLFNNGSWWLKMTENPEHMLSPVNYSILIDNGIKFYYEKHEFFSISGNAVEEKYDVKGVENLLNSFDIIWKIHHDIMRAMDGCSRNNLCFRIDDRGVIWIHNYNNYIMADKFNDIYNFVVATNSNIKNLSKLNINDKKLLDFLSANMVGVMKQCIQMNGALYLDDFVNLCACIGIDKKHAVEIFYNSGNILQHLTECGLVNKWGMLSSTSYEAEFFESEIFKYECYESHKNITVQMDGYSLRETRCLFPNKYTKEFLKDKASAVVCTLEILKALDDERFCMEFEEEIVCAITNMDKKYIPLLKLKLLREGAQKVMGKKLFNDLKSIVKAST